MTNKIVCRIKQPILYLKFLSSEFIDTVLALFVDAIFVIFPGKVIVTFVDSLSITFIIYNTHFLKYQQYFSNTFHSRKYMCYSSIHNLFCTYDVFTLALTFIIILILIWIASCTIEYALATTLNMFYQCFSFMYSCYNIKTFYIYIICFTGNT